MQKRTKLGEMDRKRDNWVWERKRKPREERRDGKEEGGRRAGIEIGMGMGREVERDRSPRKELKSGVAGAGFQCIHYSSRPARGGL